MTQQQEWHPADIRAALQRRGWSWARISRHMGHKTHSASSHVLTRHWPAVEALVGEIVGVHPAKIWPGRYRTDGSPRGRGVRREYDKLPHAGNSKSAGAA